MHVRTKEGQREFTWAWVKGDAMGKGAGGLDFH